MCSAFSQSLCLSVYNEGGLYREMEENLSVISLTDVGVRSERKVTCLDLFIFQSHL